MRNPTFALSVAACLMAGCLDALPAERAKDRTFQTGLPQYAALGAADRVAVAVHFEDVFCSAHLDTVSDDGPLFSLYVGGHRVRTVVLGVACTGGTGDVNTALYAQAIKVACTSGGAAGTARLDIGKTPDGMQAATGPVTGWSIQRGAEALSCGGDSCKKVFWSLAFALDDNATDCTVTTKFTASGSDPSNSGLLVTQPEVAGPGTCFDANDDGDCGDAGEQDPAIDGFGSCVDLNGDLDCDDTGEQHEVARYWRTPADTIYPIIDINGAVKDAGGWLDVQYAFDSGSAVGATSTDVPVSFCVKLDAAAAVSAAPLCSYP